MFFVLTSKDVIYWMDKSFESQNLDYSGDPYNQQPNYCALDYRAHLKKGFFSGAYFKGPTIWKAHISVSYSDAIWIMHHLTSGYSLTVEYKKSLFTDPHCISLHDK